MANSISIYRRQAHRDKSYDGEQPPISFGTLHTREAGWLKAHAPAEARGVKRVAYPNPVASLASPRYRDACSAMPSGANDVAVDRPEPGAAGLATTHIASSPSGPMASAGRPVTSTISCLTGSPNRRSLRIANGFYPFMQMKRWN